VATDPQSPTPPSLSGPRLDALSKQLGIILGFVDLALSQTPPADPRRADLVEIRRAAVEALTIIGRPVAR
jgi:hypothetical protein